MIHKKLCALFFLSFLFTFPTPSELQADICGKFDLGPAYLHIDVLESGKTVQSINMPGLRGDSTIILWKGVCLKPFLTYGGKGNSQVITGGCGVGHYTPIGDKCSVTPSVGCSYTNFRTHYHYHVSPETTVILKELFQSISPYVSLDASFCFSKGWRVIGSYQYVWSFTHTTIKGMGETDSRPTGSNYGLMFEWDANEKWSLNLGFGYNVSLTHEKHGIRGYGTRLGFAYWF